MFGRAGRVNTVPDAGFVDGSTDETSAAYSPMVTEDGQFLRRVSIQSFQGDDFKAQNLTTSGDWTDSFRGFNKYVDQTVGGQAGNARTLGYSTGLRPRKESRTPMTGKVLTMNNMGVHPVVGNVGRDNRANNLFAAVASQSADFTPSTEQIAAQFTGKGFNFS